MTNEEISEATKIIAKFDGYKFKKASSGKDKHGEYDVPNRWVKENVFGYKTELNYHSSWDILIPCCRKFDRLFEGKIVSAKKYRQYELLCDNIDNAVTCYDILPAFEALAQGIKWYNKQNNQK